MNNLLNTFKYSHKIPSLRAFKGLYFGLFYFAAQIFNPPNIIIKKSTTFVWVLQMHFLKAD